MGSREYIPATGRVIDCPVAERKKKYVGTWMDTMGTMIMVSQGDVTGQSLSMTSTIDDIMAGKPVTVKSEIKIAGPDRHTMEMWSPDPAGKPFKSMEIEYTRKK